MSSQLEHKLETQESEHATSLRSVRNVDRTVRDLQAQITRRDKNVQQLQDDVSKGRDKAERLLQQIEELQGEDAKSQLQARRAERDLREEKEKALRLERELEGWKELRMERGPRGGIGMTDWSTNVGGHGNLAPRDSEGVEGLQRSMSDSKGFL